MKEWAENEVKIACAREMAMNEVTEDEWNYCWACYGSALKAYKSLCDDGHSGMSIVFTKHILNRLIDHKPLTPINDTPDEWYDDRIDTNHRRGEEVCYQHKRYGSLFKYVYADGRVVYRDVDCAVGITVKNDVSWHSGLVDDIVFELFPISMPYMPPTNPYKVYVDEFLVDPANGDYDTLAMLYLIKPDGERVELNRFFAEKEGIFVPIDYREYTDRKTKRVEIGTVDDA